MNDDEYKKWLRGNGVEPEPEEDNSVTVYGMSIWGWGAIAMIAIPVIKFLSFLILNEPN